MIVMRVNAPGVAEWVQRKIPKVAAWLPGHKSIAAFWGGELLGAVVYDAFTPFDCAMHIAILDPRCVNRRTIRSVLSYPFHQLKLRRVTAQIGADNMASRKLVARVGFQLEGRKECGLGDEDELIFGLTYERARKWL